MTVPRFRARSNARRPPLRLVSALAILFATSGVGAQTPLSVGGRVLNSSGEPIERAEIHLIEYSEPLTAQPDPKSASAAWSEADGSFRVLAPEAGVWRVLVEAPRHAPALLDLVPLTEPVELPPLRLASTSDSRVQLVDGHQGLPVARATLLGVPIGATAEGRLDAAGSWPRPPWKPAYQAVQTDSSGMARLDVDLSRSRLVVLANGFPPQRLAPGRASPRSTPRRLALWSGQKHELFAVNRAGRPVPEVLALVDGIAVGETDGDGRLVTASPNEAVTPGEGAARWPVRMIAPDGRWAVGRLAPPPAPTRLELRPPLRCRGQVVDQASDRPLGGSVIWSVAHPSRRTTADASGRFDLRLPFSPAGRIGVASAGYLPTTADFDATCSGAVVVELSAHRQLAGRVVDEADAPIAGAEIHLAPEDLPDPSPDLGAWGRSGENGRFRIAGLAPGRAYWLRATAAGFVPARLAVNDERYEAEQIVRLRRGRGLAGRVLDDATEEPLSGVRVTGRPSSAQGDAESLLTAEEIAMKATTDRAGRYELPPLPPGEVDLLATAEGYVPRRVRGVRLPAGEGVADLGPIRLSRAPVLRGLVVDPEGRALAECTVRRVGSSSSGTPTLDPPESPVACLDDGSFEITGLAPGREIRLRLESDGYRPELVDATPTTGSEVLRVELEPAAQIAGRIVDSDGEPVVGALVAVGQEGDESALFAFGNTAPTDDRGRFELLGLGSGEIEILAFAEGYLETETTVSIAQGELIDDLSLTLERGATITGLVLDPSDLPVAGASLRVLDDDASSPLGGLPRLVAQSDAEGRFRLTGLRTGENTVAADHAAFQAQRREVEVLPGEQELVIRLEPGLAVSGKVVDADGFGVSGATVSLESLSGDGGMQRTRTRGDGAFRFRGLTPGSFRAVAHSEWRTSDPARGLFELRDRPVSDLNLSLRPGAVLAGRILGVSARDLERVQIWAQTVGLPQRTGRVVDGNGYRIDALAEGDWTVRAMLPDGQELRGRVSIGPDQRQASLDLEPQGDLTFSGVATRDGEPVPGAVVVCSGAEGGGGTVSGADGRFSIGPLPPGRYMVTVLDPSGGEIRRPFDLSSDLHVALSFDKASFDDASTGGTQSTPDDSSGDRR